MKRLVLDHPYAITSAVFLILAVAGVMTLHWRREELMFILLLYFIATGAIRLDDIARQIGSPPRSSETVLSALAALNTELARANRSLETICRHLERPAPPPDDHSR
jgi:hypothetical protein